MTRGASEPADSILCMPPTVRPLVMPVSPQPDESLVGLVARSTAANVLGTTRIILDEVAPPLFMPGLVGQEFGDHADRLAQKLGCDVVEIRDRLHVYAGPPASGPVGASSLKRNWCRPVRWGSGLLERHHLDLRTRRISPGVLTSFEHHRSAWMCTLLPYCLETLDPLVSSCGHCGGRLGWRLARGIGICEHCRRRVPASADEPFDAALAESYRAFGALVSTAPAERASALSGLSPTFKDLEPTALVRLIVGLGRALDLTPDGYRRSMIVDRNDRSIATVVARGFEIIQDWPVRLRRRLEEVAAEEKSPVDRRELQSRIRSVGGYRVARSVHDDLLREAVPEIFEHAYKAMSFREPIVLTAAACKEIGIDREDFRKIEEAGHFTGTETTEGTRVHRQYSAARITQIATAWRGSTRSTAIAFPLGVPAYAIEQLACTGRLTRVEEPAVADLDDQLRLTTKSATGLLAALETAGRDCGIPPDDAVSLCALSRWTGGRMKPWAHVLEMLADRTVPCWRDLAVADPPPRGSTFTYRTLVRPADAERLFGTAFDEATKRRFPFASEISKHDAAEILNADHGQITRVIKAGAVAFDTGQGRSHRCDLALVVALARRTITAAELGFLLNQNYSFVCRLLARHSGVRRDCLGWRRADVLKHWDELIGAIVANREEPRRRRVLPAPLPEGHAELALDRLKASLACTS